MARLPFVGLLAGVVLTLTGCFPFFVVGDGGIHADGTVSDSTGRPIAQALVFFDSAMRATSPNSFERRTAVDGRLHLSTTVPPGRYNVALIVQASGYREAKLPLPTLRRNTVEVKLERDDSGRQSQIILVVSK